MTMTNYWNRKEEEILTENFEKTEWKKLLSLLPNKSDKQILRKANKFNLKREPELIDRYYDEEQNAWIDKKRLYLKESIMIVNGVFPISSEYSFDETLKLFSRNFSKNFYEIMVKNQYKDFLKRTGLEHNDELYKLFWDIRQSGFFKEELPDKEMRIEEVFKIIQKERINNKR